MSDSMQTTSSRTVGDRVRLLVGNAYGMLNPISLREDGWDGEPVEIVEINGKDYRVVLPHGERWITEQDIIEG